MHATAHRTVPATLFIALICAVVIACGLACAPATAHAQDDQELGTQANGKTDVWVVTGAEVDFGDGSIAYTYAYNNNGTLKKFTSQWAGGSTATTKTYTYSGTRVKSCLEKGWSTTKTNLKYNAAGQLVKRTAKSTTSFGTYSNIDKFSYNKKGLMTKRVSTSDEDKRVTKYTKYDKEGRVIEQQTAYTGEEPYVMTYAYDSHGNLSEFDEITVKSKYDANDCLVAKSFVGESYTYTYKKISIPSSAVAAVQHQQLKLLNAELPIFDLP